MADTYRTGGSHDRFSAEPRTYDAEAAHGPSDLTHDREGRGVSGRNQDDELRRQQRADLFYEDSIVMLGILIGGVVGYIAASTVRKPDWSSRRTQRSSEGGVISRYFNRSSQSSQVQTSSSINKDETTDMIASNKVEGTAVYNRQGEKLGEVYNFMVGKRSGEVAYAIMSFGGFLGIGQKYHPMPWDVLTYDTDKKGYVIDADKERLVRAPNYAVGEEPFARPEYGQEVRDYWSAGST